MKPFFYAFLITDPKYFTEESFVKSLFKYTPNITCFRDKSSSNIEELATIFLKVCKQNNTNKILINSNIQLAIKLGFDGVHLTSTQFEEIQIAKQNNLFVIISCHNEDDIQKAQEYKADIVTYSPIFKTPNKSEPKGCNELKRVVNRFNIPIIALGGIITKSQVNQIKETNAFGFASIRYFVEFS